MNTLGYRAEHLNAVPAALSCIFPAEQTRMPKVAAGDQGRSLMISS